MTRGAGAVLLTAPVSQTSRVVPERVT
ncbi:hypothetical protein ACWCP6_22800 [Streptomyces sp. NPDC002004]